MNITYRAITSTDFSFLKEMLYETIYVPEGEDPYPISILELPEISKYISNWGRQGDFGFIASINNSPVGAAWARLFNEQNKGYGFVNAETPELSIAIKQSYRSKGIGNQLMKQMIALAKEKGYKQLSLSVDKRSRAVLLYKKLNFEIIDDLETAYTMLLKL